MKSDRVIYLLACAGALAVSPTFAAKEPIELGLPFPESGTGAGADVAPLVPV